MEDRVKLIFAYVVAYLAVFIASSVILGFIWARLNGIAVDVDKFYEFIGVPFGMLIAKIMDLLGSPKK